MPPAQGYDQAKTQVEGLVERFARNLDAYKRTDYKEAQARVEFIDPLFEALGWDVRNTKGYAEQYKDVVHEDAPSRGRMLDLHQKLAATTIPADKRLYQRQIEATDRQIDALVYELYDLTQVPSGATHFQSALHLIASERSV